MPVETRAYHTIREHAGLFDASKSFGRIFARGKEAIDLLHRLCTNDLHPLEQTTPSAQLTFLTNEKGRIVDLLKVVSDPPAEPIVITSAGKEEAIIQWLDKFTIMEDARFEPATQRISQFLVCGPESTAILKTYCSEDIARASRTSVFHLNFGSVPAALLKAPSLAGSGWFILSRAENAMAVWNALEQSLSESGGEILDDTLFGLLRIENGTPIAPNELNEKHNPLELPTASEAVSFTKGCYIGQEVIARLDAQQKVQRRLMGLRFEGKMPAIGSRMIDSAIPESAPLGNEIGEVTSVASSPKFGAIGLGYVRGKYANPGTTVLVQDEQGDRIATMLAPLPFSE